MHVSVGWNECEGQAPRSPDPSLIESSVVSALWAYCTKKGLIGSINNPNDIVEDFACPIRGKVADSFNQPAFINHHYMGASCQAGPWKVCFTLVEKHIARKRGVLCLFCQGHNHHSAKCTPIDRIPLNNDHRSSVSRLGSRSRC